MMLAPVCVNERVNNDLGQGKESENHLQLEKIKLQKSLQSNVLGFPNGLLFYGYGERKTLTQHDLLEGLKFMVNLHSLHVTFQSYNRNPHKTSNTTTQSV